MPFVEKIIAIQKKNNSLVCVGLDPDSARIPECCRSEPSPLFAFNKRIIDATADLACAFKPQFAYYAAQAAEEQLVMTIAYIQKRYPEMPVILDVKRNDIGATAQKYASEAFDRYKADALTVNPYMGGDTLKPFLDRADKGVIALCRTSNPGAGDFQDLVLADGSPLYETVARKAASEWNYNNNIALVVGATWPEQLAAVRDIVGDMFLLAPGIGAQGGDIEAVVRNGRAKSHDGLIINSSRGVIYAGDGEDFDALARLEAQKLRDAINAYR